MMRMTHLLIHGEKWNMCHSMSHLYVLVMILYVPTGNNLVHSIQILSKGSVEAQEPLLGLYCSLGNSPLFFSY